MLVFKYFGISKMEKIKNILVFNIEYLIWIFVYMFEWIECKGFFIVMELKI